MPTVSTFDLTGPSAGSPASGEYFFGLTSGTSPVLVSGSNSSLTTVRFDVSADTDGNDLTYALAGQLLGSAASVGLETTGVLTLLDTQPTVLGPETWRADFAVKQTYGLMADGTDADVLPDGFYYKDELGQTSEVKLNWLGTRVFDGAIATFYATVNKATASATGTEFFGRVLDLNGDGIADQLVSSLGGRSTVSNITGVSDLSWRMEYAQTMSGRLQTNSAGQVSGFYFSFSDLQQSHAWRLSTLGSDTGSPNTGELYLKLDTASTGSSALVSASSPLFPSIRFDALADSDNNAMTLGLKGSLLNSAGQSQTAKGTLTFADTASATAGPEAWSARFLVKEAVSLIADGSDANSLEDGFYYTDALGHTIAVPLTWNSAADSQGVLASFSATMNQLTPADAGLALTGQLRDADRNGIPDQMVFNAGSQTLSASLQKATDTWQVYYNVDMAGRTAVDSRGNVTGLYFNPSNLSYPVSYPDVPTGFELKIKPVFWKGWGSSSAKTLGGVSIVEGGVTASSLSDGLLTLSGVEDNDGVAGDGVFQLSPTASSPSNAKSAISLTDVLAALKIYLGKSIPDAYASPLNVVAADFDQSGAVTLTDVLQLLKYYLGKTTTSVPEWVFVQSADLSGNTATASLQSATSGTLVSKAFTLTKSISHDFSVDGTELQILGVLRGDVDGSWTAA